MKIDEVIRNQGSFLLDVPGVTGIGHTIVEGKDCILVMVEQNLPEAESTIPHTLGGYPVAIQVSGVIQALRKPDHPPSEE